MVLLTCPAIRRTLLRGWEETMRRAAAIDRRSRKEERLEARVTPEQKKMITRAAALRGSSVTESLIASAAACWALATTNSVTEEPRKAAARRFCECGFAS